MEIAALSACTGRTLLAVCRVERRAGRRRDLAEVSHDADGHLFGSHENYEATVADGPDCGPGGRRSVPAMFVVAWSSPSATWPR